MTIPQIEEVISKQDAALNRISDQIADLRMDISELRQKLGLERTGPEVEPPAETRNAYSR